MRLYVEILEALADALEEHESLCGQVATQFPVDGRPFQIEQCGNGGSFIVEIRGRLFDVAIIDHGKLRR